MKLFHAIHFACISAFIACSSAHATLYDRPGNAPAYAGPRVEIVDRGDAAGSTVFDVIAIESEYRSLPGNKPDDREKLEITGLRMEDFAHGALRGLGKGAIVKVFLPGYLLDSTYSRSIYSGGSAEDSYEERAVTEYRVADVRRSALPHIAALGALLPLDVAGLKAIEPIKANYFMPQPQPGDDSKLRLTILEHFRRTADSTPEFEAIALSISNDQDGNFMYDAAQEGTIVLQQLLFMKLGRLRPMLRIDPNSVKAAKLSAASVDIAVTLLLKYDTMMYGQATETLNALRLSSNEFKVFINSADYDWRRKSVLESIVDEYNLSAVQANNRTPNFALLKSCNTVDSEVAARTILSAAYDVFHGIGNRTPVAENSENNAPREAPSQSSISQKNSGAAKTPAYFKERVVALKKNYRRTLAVFGELRMEMEWLARQSFRFRSADEKLSVLNRIDNIATKCLQTNDDNVRSIGNDLIALGRELNE